MPILIGEADYETQAPYLFNFSIADNAPAGDHTITIVHSYKYSDEWYLDKKELKIHVNAWYERGYFGHSQLSWQSLAIVLTVSAIVVTFISQLINILIHFRQRES